MHSYDRHIGDYLKDTAHLSLLEHGVYTRLLDVYYTREAPLPEDRVARLIGARTEPETQALQVVLQEFFELRDGHWHQNRCDETIEAYRAGEPEREVKKANEDNRLKRHRQERAELFQVLVSAGKHAPWNTPISELRSLVSALQAPGHETDPATPPATAPATLATATTFHLPPSTPQEGIPVSGAKAPSSPAVLTTASPPRREPDRQEDHAVPPACPLKQIVGVFALKCPTLPKPRYELWKDSTAAEAMRQRWKWLLSADAVREDGSRYATTPAEALDWFGRFFEAVHDSDFLSGRSAAWKNCDLGWLMKRENFMKVVQGNYTNKDHA